MSALRILFGRLRWLFVRSNNNVDRGHIRTTIEARSLSVTFRFGRNLFGGLDAIEFYKSFKYDSHRLCLPMPPCNQIRIRLRSISRIPSFNILFGINKRIRLFPKFSMDNQIYI